jgi:hypothetical protein
LNFIIDKIILRTSLATVAFGATIVPLLGSSDQMHLTNNSGNMNKWPVYLNLRYIDQTFRSQAPNRASIHVAIIPVPPKYHFEGRGKTTEVKEQKIHNRKALWRVLELIFRPLNIRFSTAGRVLCADGQMWQ